MNVCATVCVEDIGQRLGVRSFLTACEPWRLDSGVWAVNKVLSPVEWATLKANVLFLSRGLTVCISVSTFSGYIQCLSLRGTASSASALCTAAVRPWLSHFCEDRQSSWRLEVGKKEELWQWGVWKTQTEKTLLLGVEHCFASEEAAKTQENQGQECNPGHQTPGWEPYTPPGYYSMTDLQ